MQTLLKTNAELRSFTTASTGLDIATLISFLAHSPAEMEIIRITGREVYTDLLTNYNTEDGLTPEQNALLPFVQKPLANLALHEYIKQSGVIISSSGITLTTDREKQAFQWQHNNICSSILNTAYFALDSLIRYMFAKQADFPDWGTSSEYRLSRLFFINTPHEFNKWVNIHSNYRALVALRPYMRHIEETLLKETLGHEFYAEIKRQVSQIEAEDPTDITFFVDENGNLIAEGEGSSALNITDLGSPYVIALNLQPSIAKLLTEYIQPAVAHLTIARAIHELNMHITADGAFVHNVLASSTSNINQKEQPDVQQREAYRLKHIEEGKDWLQRLTDFLNSTATSEVYAEYYNSSLYKPEQNTGAQLQDETLKIYTGL